ncbi:phospholipase D family protein [Streptomyces sp. HUAS MG47]|uniref:phospholipase D family protein n=1 Tax=Streptomyces solicamelliae TaxID=3231716 RepID=UPI003878050C
MKYSDWMLTAAERGNGSTRLDGRHPDGAAWTRGNDVRPLVHGAAYFAELLEAVRAQRAGDILLFTDWRGDLDERLDGEGSEVVRVLGEAAERGVIVKGLVWRSHLDKLHLSQAENRRLAKELEQAGAECLLDMRVRPGGSHHQKLVVLRHPGRPERDVAYIGGVDLCHSRNDDAAHRGDPQAVPFASAYGGRPPWHDVQLAIRGPAVGDLEAGFRERWDDPSPLSRSPLVWLRQLAHREDISADPLPPQLPDPAPVPDTGPGGSHTVQVLRTYPNRLLHGYPFAPDGERSIARGYVKALRRARSLIYLEDQYLWSTDVVGFFAQALVENPGLRLIAVIPTVPEQDGRLTLPMNLVGRVTALDELRRAGGARVAVYGLENPEGDPVYVHAKVCVIDDVWAAVGSDNVNLRSWTHDSELGCVVLDDDLDERPPADPGGLGDGARRFARDLRLELCREHLEAPEAEPPYAPGELCDPVKTFDILATRAAALDTWYENGRHGPRPPGRLRTYHPPDMPHRTRVLAMPLYHLLVDPDGRPARFRRRNTY